MDKAAQKGDPAKYPLPHPKVEGSPYDFSFSGLKTAVINLIHNASQKGQQVDTDSLCASFQKTVAEILTGRLMLAAQNYGYRTIVVAGGVSANSGLRTMLTEACKQHGYALYMPPLSLCGDNAAMIGSQAYYEYLDGQVADLSLNGTASMPIDQPLV